MTETTPFGAHVAKLMQERNKTAYAIARDSKGGITRMAVTRLVNGERRDPTDESMDAIARGLELGPLQRLELYLAAGRIPTDMIPAVQKFVRKNAGRPSPEEVAGISISEAYRAANSILRQQIDELDTFIRDLYNAMGAIAQIPANVDPKKVMDLITRSYPEVAS